MYKLLHTTYKEMLLLSRDPGGLIILFVMPLLLIITVTIIQDGSFRTIDSTRIPVLLVDLDKGELAKEIRDNFNQNGIFEAITQQEGVELTEAMAQEAVFNGAYQLAVVIPTDLSANLKKKFRKMSAEY